MLYCCFEDAPIVTGKRYKITGKQHYFVLHLVDITSFLKNLAKVITVNCCEKDKYLMNGKWKCGTIGEGCIKTVLCIEIPCSPSKCKFTVCDFVFVSFIDE